MAITGYFGPLATVGQAVEQVRRNFRDWSTAWNSFVPGTPLYLAVELVDVYGLRAIKVTWPADLTGPGAPELIYYYLVGPLSAGEKIPLRYLVTDPLWSGVSTASYFAARPGHEFAGTLDEWNNVVLATMNQIVNDWTPGVEVNEMADGFEDAARHTATWIRSAHVTSDTEVMVWHEQLRAWDGGELQWNAEQMGPPVIGPQGPTSISLSVDSLVQPIKDISGIDATVSINNKGPIFSVRGQTVIP